jgi:hypothetical protein
MDMEVSPELRQECYARSAAALPQARLFFACRNAYDFWCELEGARKGMPQFWKGEAVSNGFRVRYAAKSNGSTEAREADLVFMDERPFAVLEWAAAGAAMVTIELDPAKLRAADATGRVYEYSELLTDPR